MRSVTVRGMNALSRRLARLFICVLLAAAPLAHANSDSGAEAAADGDSIWPRIAQGMRIVDPEEPETVTWARWYAKHPDQFSQILARSQPFMWYIVEAVELRDMPLELALLPAVESGFNPQAQSQKKARGLWQFVPTTGKSLGLRENAFYDGKCDVVASTRAALDYLQSLNRRYDSWLLALAAYNVGSRNLSNSIKQAGNDVFWGLKLPKETREHVPRLLGVALLIKQPERFGVTLPPMPAKPEAEMIYLDGPTDLESAGADAGIEQETLEFYNPGLKQLSNTSSKRVVLLPALEAASLRTVLAAGSYKAKPAKQVEHVIARGDSLWVIARQYKVSVAQLREWNQLDAKTRLKPGRTLRVLLAS